MERTNIAALESQNECRLATGCGVLHLKLDFSGGSLVHGQKLDGSLEASHNSHDGSLGDTLAHTNRALGNEATGTWYMGGKHLINVKAFTIGLGLKEVVLFVNGAGNNNLLNGSED